MRGLSPLDRWTLTYAAVVTAALGLRWPERLPYPGLLLTAHGLLALAAALAHRARRAGRLGELVGELYPLILTAALYTEVGLINAAAGVSQDARVQAWEEALFRGQPSWAWIRAWPWPWLSWVLHLGYLSYYLILAAAPLGLWFSGRRDGARRTTLLMMATFYVCYTVFLCFPVAGPRYTFPRAENAAAATPPALLTWRLLEGAAAWGTAFPSSHVAVSLVASVSAAWSWRPLGAGLGAAAVLLALGTVYGQFHYAVDAIAGVALAAVVLAAGRRCRP
jgi:membrane-associated phospholipid phosphatase